MPETEIISPTPRWLINYPLAITKDLADFSPLARLVDDVNASIYNQAADIVNLNEAKNKTLDKARAMLDSFTNADPTETLIRSRDLITPTISITGNMLTSTTDDFTNDVAPVKKVQLGDKIVITYFQGVTEKILVCYVSAILNTTQLKLDHDFGTGASSVRFQIFRVTKSVNSIKDDITTAIGNFTNDLSETGGKFIISYPFFGGMGTARRLAVDYLTSNQENFPNFSENSHTASLGIFCNMGKDLKNFMKFLIVFKFLFEGKSESMVQEIDNYLNNPILSPFLDLIENELISTKQSLVDTGLSFTDPINNVFDTGESLFKIIGSETLQDDLKSIWDNSIAKDIPFNFLDPTNTDTALGSILNTIEQAKDKDLFNFNPEKNPFTEMVKRAVTPAVPNLFSGLASQPYDTWFNLLTLGDLFPGIKQSGEFATKLVNEVAGTLTYASNGLKNGLDFMKNITDQVAGAATDLVDAATNVTDKLKTEAKLLSFDLFYTPAMEGGTEQLRYVYEQSLRTGVNSIPNLPEYDSESVTVMILITFGGPSEVVKTGLTTVTKLFNIDMIEA